MVRLIPFSCTWQPLLLLLLLLLLCGRGSAAVYTKKALTKKTTKTTTTTTQRTLQPRQVLSSPVVVAPPPLPSPDSVWSWYKNMLVTRPIPTKAATAATLMCSAELVCQVLLNNKKKSTLNWRRAVEVSVVGLVWNGPAYHAWYQRLDQLVHRIHHELPRLVAMLTLDNLIFSPFTIGVYFVLRSLLEGTGVAGAREKLTTKFWSTVWASYRLWPAANAINFAVVPLPFRVLYVNLVSMIWSGYLSFVTSTSAAAAATTTTTTLA